jgi:CDP-glucose 4,6-dehydratase
MLLDSYRNAYFHPLDAPLLASARAGNVIGGGDWSEDRLIPDLMRAIAGETSLEIRSPNATRPWQHVLESLSGYLLLGQRLLEGRREMAESWNFGPEPEDNRSVSQVLTTLNGRWPELAWHVTVHPQPHEANLLNLDSTKAKTRLGWRPIWDLDATLTATINWYREFYSTGGVVSSAQLADYMAGAYAAGVEWCRS